MGRPATFAYANGRLQALESDTEIPMLRPHIDPAVALSERLTGPDQPRRCRKFIAMAAETQHF